MLVCAETRPAVSKIMASWNQQPLVAALTTQQVGHLPFRVTSTAESAAGCIALVTAALTVHGASM